MAYFSMHAYDADVWIRGFSGLNQGDILMNPNPNYAAEAENVETPNGVLQPQADCPQTIGLGARIETLASFHRRWYAGEGSRDWYVCCSGGKFYYRQAHGNNDWAEIEMPSGVDAFSSSVWSWVTYELTPDNSETTVDVLIMSNAVDGMIMIIPPDAPFTWGQTKERTWGYEKDYKWKEVSTARWYIDDNIDTGGKKFGIIERYEERIWGTAIEGDPDLLMYSKPYDPTDWTENQSIPEDGAGDIPIPTWDGDKFTSLKRFGSQLLAFKKNSIWKITGTNPGEFSVYEQYGEGTIYPHTIIVKGERAFFCTEHGLCAYDGMSSVPYQRKMIEQIWNNVNPSALDEMCSALYRNRMYIALPLGDSSVNNAMIVYDFTEGTFLLYKDMFIEDMMVTDDALFATSSKTEWEIFSIGYDSWLEGKASGRATKWVSPWMDFGYKRIQKGGFDLYFVPEVKDESVTLHFTMETEKKAKKKDYIINPLQGSKTEFKGKRLHFSGNGRKFRLIIETDAGVTAPWRLIGGLQMVVETDPD